MANKKYYAVTKGNYSDYHIITITADKQKANKLAKKYSDAFDKAYVEEYEDCLLVDRAAYRVQISDSGSESIADITTYVDVKTLNHVSHFTNSWNNDGYYTVSVQAKDANHALKIAYDLIAEYKAPKEGVVL